MAYHFSANQYEDKYSPRKLGNWEYPKWYPERPRQRLKPTKIIADDNGRLLEGIKRENPWGNYVGTWDLPRRITRDYVKKLVAPPERLVNLWEKKKKNQPEQPTEEVPQVESEEKVEHLPALNNNIQTTVPTSFQRRNKSCSALDLRSQTTKLQPLTPSPEKHESLHDIKPGDLDEKIKDILVSVQEPEKPSLSPEEHLKETKAFPKRTKKKTHVENNVKQEYQEEYKYLNSLDEHLNKYEKVAEYEEDEKEPEIDFKTFDKPEVDKFKSENSEAQMEGVKKPDVKNGFSGFQIAKRFHDENLRHKPLPDVINDPVFKALSSSRHPNPGGALEVQPMPSAIGWKYYTAPGPTECSKLKIYRPKTAVDKVKPHQEPRPKTGGSKTEKSKKRFLPIDLAICWDLKPDDPSDEPKRSPHIDGSNGSAAPAVFTMIKPTEELEEPSIPGSSQAVIERIPKGIQENNVTTLPSQTNGKLRSPFVTNKEAIMTCIKSPPNGYQKQKTDSPDSFNSISTNAAEYARRNPKTAWSNEDTSKALSERLQNLQSGDKHSRRNSSESLQKKKTYQSTPNLTTVCEGSNCGTEKNSTGSLKGSDIFKTGKCDSAKGSDNSKSVKQEKLKTQKNEKKKNRSCSACEVSNSGSEETREKTEFKAAFKAGVAQAPSSNSGSSSTAKSYKAPKMRLPYAKRSYSIGTLVPPFSLWRENNGQAYPEHWRLASVYQHSYKPINTRKRPLLATVYQ